MKQHILILRGISGSGKTTYAKRICREQGYKRVNRDDLREMLFGLSPEQYYKTSGIGTRENIITGVQNLLIEHLLELGESVVVDNTNLKESVVKSFNSLGVETIVETLDVPLETAIQRDLKRERTVGRQVIEKQFKQLNNGK